MDEKGPAMGQLPSEPAYEDRGGVSPAVERAGLTDLEKVERVYR